MGNWGESERCDAHWGGGGLGVGALAEGQLLELLDTMVTSVKAYFLGA